MDSDQNGNLLISSSPAYFSFLISFSGMLEGGFSLIQILFLCCLLSGKGNALILGNFNAAIENKPPDKKCIAHLCAALKTVGKNVVWFPLGLGSK